MANPSSTGFRTTTHSPEELERFAALFIPTWELPAEIAAGPDPGFKAAPIDAGLVAALAGDELPKAKPQPIKQTMMGMSAPLIVPEAPAPVPPVVAAAAAPAADAAPIVAAPVPTLDAPKPMPMAAPMPAPRPARVAVDDDEPLPAKKRGGVLYAVIGGVVLLGAVGAFFATRGGDQPAADKNDKKESVTEKKAMDLPEPAAAPEPAKAAEPAKTEEPAKPAEPAKAAEPTKTVEPAKAAPPPPPPAKAAPPPPPPVVKAAPPPPPAAKAAPPPPAKTTPPPAKKPKIKDEF